MDVFENVEPNKFTANFNELLHVEFGDAVVPLFDNFIKENGEIKDYFYGRDGLHLNKLGKTLLKNSIEFHTLKFENKPVHPVKVTARLPSPSSITWEQNTRADDSKSKVEQPSGPRPVYRPAVQNITFLDGASPPKLGDNEEFPPLVGSMSPTGCLLSGTRTGYACALKKPPALVPKQLIEVASYSEKRSISRSGSYTNYIIHFITF